MTLVWSLVAIGISAAAIAALGVGDPKRRRTAGLVAVARRRNLLLALLLLPGVALALTAQPAAFMIWLGGSVVAGWAISAALPQGHKAR